MELKFILESLLFSAQKPMSPRELRDVLASGERARIEDEYGDLLFACVNVGRFLNREVWRSSEPSSRPALEAD